MCEQIGVIEVTEISSQVQSWQRTVEQILDDTRHEPMSRISEMVRELNMFLNLEEKIQEKKERKLRKTRRNVSDRSF